MYYSDAEPKFQTIGFNSQDHMGSGKYSFSENLTQRRNPKIWKLPDPYFQGVNQFMPQLRLMEPITKD